MANNKLYDESSIQSLSPLEFTRLRPGVYCGSTEYATQPVIEIVSNAIDEFKAGHGNQIDVIIYDDKRCKVRDYGQGFLINSKREDGKTILQAAFDTLNTSGKFSEDGVYEGTALGLNGIGSKLTNFLSHWLIVRTCRDGKFKEIKFVEGVFESRKTGKMETTDTVGTCVEWLPSEEFFTSNEVEINKNFNCNSVKFQTTGKFHSKDLEERNTVGIWTADLYTDNDWNSQALCLRLYSGDFETELGIWRRDRVDGSCIRPVCTKITSANY